MITKLMLFIEKAESIISQSINERYINLIGNDNLKNKYKDDVYLMLRQTYDKIGGIKGNGFSSPDDLLNIPFWKLVKKDDRIIAVVLYKDKDGRKSVLSACDGTKLGIMSLIKIKIKDIETGRAWMEISNSLVQFMKRQFPDTYIQRAIPFDQAKEKLSKLGDEIFRPADDHPLILEFPELKDCFYQRLIGGEYITKIIFGNLNAPKIEF